MSNNEEIRLLRNLFKLEKRRCDIDSRVKDKLSGEASMAEALQAMGAGIAEMEKVTKDIHATLRDLESLYETSVS